jgi:hypothetical protein
MFPSLRGGGFFKGVVMIKDSLVKLKLMVNGLEQRDDALRQDHHLFEKFFENFPLPVSLWSVNKEGKVLSCKGNGFLNPSAKIESELFLCEKVKCQILETEDTSDIREFFIESGDNTYYSKVMTRRHENNIIGTIGMAWDISSNLTMLGSLIKIQEIVAKDFNKKEITEWVNNGLAASKIRILIERLFIK